MTLLYTRFLFASAALFATLAGCGGSGGTAAPTPPVVVDNSGVRGSLIRNPPDGVLSLDTAGVQSRINQFGDFGTRLSAVAGAPACGVDILHFEYATVGAAGEQTTASGALMVPTGSAATCTGARPIVMYAHGFSEVKSTNMADTTPQAPYGTESIELAAMYAAQGWIVVAPNYAGYDTSTLTYHPHHIADQQSKDMIDALSAARKAFANLAHPVTDNGKLFLTGHSEGGYVTMATLRAMQQAGIAVTAAAPSSGQYAASVGYEAEFGTPGALDDLSGIAPNDILQYVVQFTAWQKADGDFYQTPSDIYPDAYAATMETLAPNDVPAATLIATGKLPAFVLADDEPFYPGLTAAEKAYFGSPGQSLVKTAFLQAIIADIAAHPCPVTSTTEPLACTHTNTAREAWFKNDLRTWTPAMPLLMCGGHGDSEVPFFNTQLTYAYFQSHGLAANSANVLDVDSPATANDPYTLAKAIFVEAEQAVVASGGDPTAEDTYHGVMVSLACQVAGRDFFKTFQ